MKHFILTSVQADAIEGFINSQFPDGLKTFWTIDIKAGKLADGNYAINDIRPTLIEYGYDNFQQTLLDNLSIDINALPFREIDSSEWVIGEW